MAEDYDDDVEEGAPVAAKSGGGKKKLIILVVLPLLLIVGAAAGAYFTGLADPVLAMLGVGGNKHVAEEKVAADKPLAPPVFYELPEILVNLNPGQGRRPSLLKIKVRLELAAATDTPKIEAMLPRIVDSFQVYLRELRVEDLQGAAGMYRLREELMMRVNRVAAPAKINDVLFQDVLVQ